MHVTAILTRAEDGFVAYNPETGTTTQGDTLEAALSNLHEAVVLYLEEFPMTFGAAPLITTFAVADA
ncbi:MAG TPA: type II toxin-antitoxin system HicB family antitoxin [Sphingomonas sp.]|uniref:type II toxin-antitoxin system HicB family antitoxin n=1 Tax=Sphingomonas sp. TaxID=28214 RepID=UPI002EDBA763